MCRIECYCYIQPIYLFKQYTILTYHVQSYAFNICSPGIVCQTNVISSVLGISQTRNRQGAIIVIDDVSRQGCAINSSPVASGAWMSINTTVKGERFGSFWGECRCFIFILSSRTVRFVSKASDYWSLCEWNENKKYVFFLVCWRVVYTISSRVVVLPHST